MTATAAQIARLRRMVAEPTTETYLDPDIQEAIERYPLPDENGEEPRIPIADMSRPVIPVPGPYTDATDLVDNPDWIPTYDLNMAAADIWEEKAGVVAGDYDFSADGGNYSRSQAYEQCMKQARNFRSKRSPRTVKLKPQPHRRQSTMGGVL